MHPSSEQVSSNERSAAAWPRALLAGAAGALLAGSMPLLWPATPWPAALATAGVAALVAGAAAWRRPAAAGPQPAPPVATESLLHDLQTGMFHRTAFLALAERDWLRAGRYGGAVALLLVEIDRLRPLTEQMGSQVADALLAGLGRQVMASLRAADLLARFDEAQIAVFLPQADATGALDVGDRIRAMVEQLQLPGLPEGARFSASVGVAVLRPLHQPLNALVAMAQQALRSARQTGGNCVRAASAEPPWMPARSAGQGEEGRPEKPRNPGRAGEI